MIDCTTCGACCANMSVLHVGSKEKPEWKLAGCSALDGIVGKKVKCMVYKDRPNACRNFEPNSSHCKFARSLFLLKDNNEQIKAAS